MSTSGAHGLSVQGFTVLPVKFKETSRSCHYLYLKEHSVRGSDESKPVNRTLFVLNVPSYCTQLCLRRLFSDCGHIQHVYLHKKPNAGAPTINVSKYFPSEGEIKGFKVAYIVFKKAQSVQNAKNLSYSDTRILSTAEEPLLTGVNKWCAQYRQSTINAAELQREIDDYMSHYDAKAEEEKQLEKEQEGVPDDEGWVTVTRHGKNKGAPRTEVQEQRVTAKEKKKRKEKELLNFYTFQMRESKREHIAQLRVKFEEDKQKIALMKASRKFRPY